MEMGRMSCQPLWTSQIVSVQGSEPPEIPHHSTFIPISQEECKHCWLSLSDKVMGFWIWPQQWKNSMLILFKHDSINNRQSCSACLILSILIMRVLCIMYEIRECCNVALSCVGFTLQQGMRQKCAFSFTVCHFHWTSFSCHSTKHLYYRCANLTQ